MISEKYMNLLDQMFQYHNVDFHNAEDILTRMNEDFVYLAEEYRKNKYSEQTTALLFVLARRSYEYIEMVTEKSLHMIITEAKDLHERKNAGYSGIHEPWYNFRQCELFNISTIDGIITRMTDKFTRLNNILSGIGVDKVGEDTLEMMLDFAAYCLIAIVIIEEPEELSV